MSPFLEKAIHEIQQLPENQQQQIAAVVLEMIQQKQSIQPKKAVYFLSPSQKGSGHTNTSINHDQVMVESILHNQ